MAKFFILLSLVLVLTEARQLTEEQVQQLIESRQMTEEQVQELTDAWQLAEAQGIQYHTEAAGSDLYAMPIPLDGASTVFDCEALCANRRSCSAFVYIPGNCGGAHKCWLKWRDPGNQKSDVCRVSAAQSQRLN